MSNNVGNVQVKLTLDSAMYEQGVKAAVRSMNTLSASLSTLGVGFGAIQIKDFIEQVSQSAIKMDGLTNRFNAAAGSATVGADSMQFVRNEAQKLGLVFVDTADAFSGFEAAALRSGLTLGQTKNIFDDVASAVTSLHLSGEQTRNVFMALEQMASKGKVQMQELRLQLGNNLPGAFELAAKAAGVSTAKFNEMMSKGEVISSEFLPKFSKVIKEQLGGAAATAAQQTNAQFNRLNTAFFNISSTIGQNLNPALVKLAIGLTGTLNATDREIQKMGEWASVNQQTINSVSNMGMALLTSATIITVLYTGTNKLIAAYASATEAINAVKTAQEAATIATAAAEQAELALYYARLKGDSVLIADCIKERDLTAAKAAGAVASANSARATALQYLAVGNLSKAFEVATVAAKEFTVALLTNPWTWVVVGITAATVAFFKYQNSVKDTQKAIDDLNSTQDKNVNKTTEAINTIKELQGAKNLDYEQTKRLDSAIAFLTAKYPNYIGRLRQELALKGQITQATAEEIANEITLAKVKELNIKKAAIDKDVENQKKSYRVNNEISAARFGTTVDVNPKGRTGVYKNTQKQQDLINKQLKDVKKEREGIVNSLKEVNKPSVISGFSNTPLSSGGKKKKTKSGEKGDDAYDKAKQQYENYLSNQEIKGVELTNNQKLAAYKSYLGKAKKTAKEETDYKKGMADLVKQSDKDSLDLKLANLDVEKYAVKRSDEEIYQYDLQKINLRLSKEKEGTVGYAQVLAEKEQLELEHQQKINDIKSQTIIDDVEYNKEELDNAASNLELEFDAHKITKKKMLETELSYINKKREYEKQALKEQLALVQGNAAEEVKVKRASNRNLEAINNEYNRKNQELWQYNHAGFTTFNDDLAQGWGNTVRSLVNGDATISDAFTAMENTILDSFADCIGQMVTQWLTDHLRMTAITQLFGANKVATDQVVNASNASVIVSHMAVGQSALQSAIMSETASGIQVEANTAIGLSSMAAAGETATAGGVMTGAAAAMGAGVTAATMPIGKFAASMAALALSCGALAIELPIIALSTTIMALSSALCALSIGLMNAGLMLTNTSAMMFAPISAMLVAELATVTAAAEVASRAVAQLAVSMAAESAAAIPFVGWMIAPAAALATAASIVAADALLEFREKGGPVKKGQPYVVGEKRPELFVPDRDGTILPNTNSLNGGGNSYQINIAMPVSATDAKSFESRIDSITDRIHSNLLKGIKKRQLKPLANK